MMALDPATLYLYVSMALNMVLYLLVGVYLVKRSLDRKIYSMIYFALLLNLISICFVVYIAAGGPSELFYLLRTGGIFMGYVFLKKTFYEDKKLKIPFKYIVMIGIITVTVTAVLYTSFRLTGIREFKIISDILFGAYMGILAIWQFIASKSAYDKVKNFNLDPYIKKRYQIFSYGSVIFFLAAIFGGMTGIPPRGILTVYLFSIMSTLNLIYLVITYLVWVMPSGFKAYLNKGFTPDVDFQEGELSGEELDGLSEEELMAMLMEE